MLTSQGIDYGMGLSNCDIKTGIRYGVISTHSLNPDVIYDVMSEGSDYGPATCPKCGNAAVDNRSDCPECADIENDMTRRDYHCHNCGADDPTKFDGAQIPIYCFDSDMAFGDDPIGWAYTDDGYKLTGCLDNDVFVIESPFYTYAAFCSPCVPGAGNLDSPMEPGDELAKVYCLSHDWFENDKAPYRVFRVADNTEVLGGE